MRRYNEPVDVHRRDDTPAEFVWRSRRYVVWSVYGSWMEIDPWWLPTQAQSLHGITSEQGAAAPMPPVAERQVWRVEAGREKGSGTAFGGTGVFDLCFDWTAGGWKLLQVVD